MKKGLTFWVGIYISARTHIFEADDICDKFIERYMTQYTGIKSDRL